MHVLATAGHVDHGKSTLVRALTGMEPDRLAEERRRGLTIDLGFAWTRLSGGEQVAFVDVPGHERFVSTMLAGVGPVPAVMLVVAADGGWSAQTEEHVAVLDALGVDAGLVVVTRADLADPAPVRAEVADWLAETSLAGLSSVSCSAVTGAGLSDLRQALAGLVTGLPAPDVDAPTRLWIDRAFTIRGAGTVVTGTLAAGRLRTGDELLVARTGAVVGIRGLQSLNEQVPSVSAVARIAVNLRGISAADLGRGDALLTPGRWALTLGADVQLMSAPLKRLPVALMMHVGAAAHPVRARRLGDSGLRLSFSTPIALSYGDRVLLRDPGSRSIAGADVVDPLPAPLPRRRGAAVRRGAELTNMMLVSNPDAELRRRGMMRAAAFATLGLGMPNTEPIGDWLLDPGTRVALTDRLVRLAVEHRRGNPLDAGLAAGAAARALGLPDPRLLPALLAPPWHLVAGRLTSAQGPGELLPHDVKERITRIRDRLRSNPFDAPNAQDLAELDLTPTKLAAAVRAGLLIAIGDGVVLAPEAPEVALARLRSLEQPFTTSQARIALETSRRVAVPLLQWLDAAGLTQRLADDRRQLRPS